jgi:hypothetical protein
MYRGEEAPPVVGESHASRHAQAIDYDAQAASR